MLNKPKREPTDVKYIPVFGRKSLTPFYDLMMKWAARESTFKPRLVEQAGIKSGHRVLDVGCGTATLTVLIKKTQPEAEVIGVDGDPEILRIARSKVTRTGLNIKLDYGMAFELPYPEQSFDHVFSSMVLHHLTHENKIRSLKEILRVLKHGGELHVADLGTPQNAPMYVISLVMRRLEETSDVIEGQLPQMLRMTGFEEVEKTAKIMTFFGTVALYRARKSAD